MRSSHTRDGRLRVACCGLVVQAVTSCTTSPDPPPPGEYAHLARVGQVALRRGDLESARARFERAREVALAAGRRREAADAAINLGLVAESEGDLAAARDRFREAARAADDDEYAAGAAAALLNLARLDIRDGRLDEAERSIERARSRWISERDHALVAALRRHQALLALARRDLDTAVTRAHQSARLYELSAPSAEAVAGEADSRLLLGRALRLDGQRTAAIAQLRRARNLALAIADRALAAAAAEEMALALRDLGHLKDARIRLEEAVRLRELTGDRDGARRDLEILLEIAREIGDAENARRYRERLASGGS